MSKDETFVPECVLYACCASKCKKRGGKQLYRLLKGELKAHRLKRVIQVIKTGCTDRCKHGPVLAVMPQNTWHLNVDELRGKQILYELLKPLT
jgi:(2Fe-2S) ferredoxin